MPPTLACIFIKNNIKAEKDGKTTAMKVKPGDKVLMSKYSGTEVKVDGEEYIIVSMGDILAVAE